MLVNGEQTNTFGQFFNGHGVLIMQPAEFGFGQRGRLVEGLGGWRQFAFYRLLALFELLQQVRRNSQTIATGQRQICSTLRKLAPMITV